MVRLLEFAWNGASSQARRTLIWLDPSSELWPQSVFFAGTCRCVDRDFRLSTLQASGGLGLLTTHWSRSRTSQGRFCLFCSRAQYGSSYRWWDERTGYGKIVTTVDQSDIRVLGPHDLIRQGLPHSTCGRAAHPWPCPRVRRGSPLTVHMPQPVRTTSGILTQYAFSRLHDKNHCSSITSPFNMDTRPAP